MVLIPLSLQNLCGVPGQCSAAVLSLDIAVVKQIIKRGISAILAEMTLIVMGKFWIRLEQYLIFEEK
jgi:hypothetical protein